MIDVDPEIYAYALFVVTIVSISALTLVLHWIPRADLPVKSIKLFRLYFMIGALGWIAGAIRDIGGIPLNLAVSAIFYIGASLVLYLAVSGCAGKHELKRSIIGFHALLAIVFLLLQDASAVLWVGTLYIVCMYSVIAMIAARLAVEHRNVGHALIALAALIALLGGVAQLYLLGIRNDPSLAHAIALIASATGFMLIGIGFLAAIFLNEHKKLALLALNDPLTGLLNRRGMEQALFTVYALTVRKHLEVSAIAIDIDHFKRINDTYGHDGGDIVLKAVAQLLVRTRRESDVCCRLGGEEFVLVLPDTPRQDATALAEHIREDLQAQVIEVGQASVRVTSSFGVASQSGKYDLDALLKDADKALYKAKERGRNRVVSASEISEP